MNTKDKKTKHFKNLERMYLCFVVPLDDVAFIKHITNIYLAKAFIQSDLQ